MEKDSLYEKAKNYKRVLFNTEFYIVHPIQDRGIPMILFREAPFIPEEIEAMYITRSRFLIILLNEEEEFYAIPLDSSAFNILKEYNSIALQCMEENENIDDVLKRESYMVYLGHEKRERKRRREK